MSFPHGTKRYKPPAFQVDDVIGNYVITHMAGREFRHDRMDYVYRTTCNRCGREQLLFQRQLLSEKVVSCASCGADS